MSWTEVAIAATLVEDLVDPKIDFSRDLKGKLLEDLEEDFPFGLI